MSYLDLRQLWKLHLVDLALLEIRKRAAALDPGKRMQAQIAALTAELEAQTAHAKTLVGEQTDIELQQKSLDDKIKRFDKDLYGGKVVNPREVETIQKEIAILKAKKEDMDGSLLELWEAIPVAQAQIDATEKKIKDNRHELAEHQKKVLVEKTRLEQEFKERSAARPSAVKEVPPALLARYEAVKQKYGGIGMVGVTKKGTCDGCGTNLPTKVVESAKEGKVITCEACHRIVYATEGLI